MTIPEKLTPKQRQTLSTQVIDENGPGTILHDFEILLDFIGPDGVEVGGKHQLLPMKRLGEINARLTHPIEIDLKRPVQKSYPPINGLYLLIRASGLTRLESSGKKQRLVIDQEALQSWRTLNFTERYFTLLETWLLWSNNEILGERAGLFSYTFYTCSEFWRDIPERGLKIAGDKSLETTLNYIPGLYNLALLGMFGLISIKTCKPAKGGGWCIARVHRTPWGDALMSLLHELFPNRPFFLEEEQETGNEFGRLQPIFQSYFPEWHHNLTFPEHEFQNGLFIFKVSLGRIWRRIAIPADAHLASFAGSILDAFDFDYDHLYRFTYKSRFGYSIDISHPYMEEEPLRADEVTIGDLEIKPGEVFTYLYDFGDEWLFQVQLERIDPVDPAVKGPQLLDSHGKAPEQYPDVDEWF